MKISFWQRLLRALELYCLIRQKELGGDVVVPGVQISQVLKTDEDTGEVLEQLELEFPDIVKNSLNADTYSKRYEMNNLPSMTVPDQSLTIREIMRRFASGLPIDGEKVPMYDEENEENDLPDLSRMDLAEREEYIESAKTELAALHVKLNAAQRKKAEKAEKSPEKAEKSPTAENLQFTESKNDPKDPAPPIS